MRNPFSYLTIWSLIISYSIFILSIVTKIPKWLFLFAACSLTTTSIVGTFFLSIPSIGIKSDTNPEKTNFTPQQIMVQDTLIHSGPLILFMIFFNLLTKRIKGQENIAKVSIMLICIVALYFAYTKLENIYIYDIFTISLISLCVFISSYEMYSRLLPNLKN